MQRLEALEQARGIYLTTIAGTLREIWQELMR